MKNNINYEDEGVFYTPSSNAKEYLSEDSLDSFDSFDDYNNRNKIAKKTTPKKLAPQKSKYPLFMGLAIGCGVLVFIILFIIMHNVFNPGGSSSSNSAVSKKNNNTLFEIEATTDSFSGKSDTTDLLNGNLGVIRIKSESFDSLTIYNIDSNENFEYKVSGATDIRDEYGKNLILEELSEGDLIEFTFDKDDTLTAVKKSNKGFKETLKNGFKIDTTKMTISASMKTYSYEEMTKFTYNKDEFDPNLLDPTIDIITISGYDNKIWSVILEKGHSEIEIVKNDKIKDGIIEIDTNIYKKLSDADTIKLTEGVHKVVVKGSNIDSFTKEISLVVNEKFTLDLSAIKIKTGKVTIKPNVTDYALYINGVLELSREPLELEYGNYTIEIVKYDYVNYSKKITVNSPEIVLSPQLTKEIKVGTLTVNSNPTGANLMIDGVSVGTTPYSGDVTQGEHSITVKKEGYKDISIGSIFISDQEAIYNVELQKE